VTDFSSITIPLLIFVAEVCVVTLNTLRTIFVSRGHKYLAPMLGFFEVLTWLLAMRQVMQNLDAWSCFFAFALGFTLGNFLGMIIEKKLALGLVSVRIITPLDPTSLIAQLRSANFGVTCSEGRGASGKVQIVMTVLKRRQLPEVVSLIETYHPSAFYAVDEVQSACEGVFPQQRQRAGIVPLPLWWLLGERVSRVLGRQPALEASAEMLD
jgi:uncharacterized protein YebE (UPF0316 family)